MSRGVRLFLVAAVIGSACVTGTEPFVLLVDLGADTATVFLGDSVQLDVVAVGANGDTVSDGRVTLSSSDSTVAVARANGWVVAIGTGFATIHATSGPAEDTVAITVTPKLILTSISAGDGYTCGVDTTGDAYCWGWRGRGGGFSLLGTGDTLDHLFPTRVAGGLKFVRVEAEGGHTCGVTVAGAAYCWGIGANGQLGDGGISSSTVPVPVSGGLQFTEIELGGNHTCGLTNGGLAYCWGRNASGEIGDSTTGGFRTVPIPVVGGLVFRTITAGDQFACGLTADSVAYCWGRDAHGEIGDSATAPSRPAPVQVHTNLRFASIASSSHGYNCAIVPGDTAYCWGHNDDFQLGRSPALFADLPVLPVSGTVSLTRTALGSLVSCGLSTSGAAYCWGASYGVGYPGNLNGGYSDVPLAIAGGLTFASLSFDGDHACGMATDGRAYCFGGNGFGQLGLGRLGAIETTPHAVIGQP